MTRRQEHTVKMEQSTPRRDVFFRMLSPGDVVDRYVVDRLIGQGGMATVYRVKHAILGSRHALKVLHESSGAWKENILHEGRIQARLDPFYVVPVTDVVMMEHGPALIMPYVEGCSLSEVLEGYQPTSAEVAIIGKAIAMGVANAHENGVVHRDLKPSNVLLQVRHGRVRIRVADFGLAWQPEASDDEEPLFVGTPQYAAPEQFEDPLGVGQQADLWGIGTILFRLLTGGVPFGGDTPEAVYGNMRTESIDFTAVPLQWKALLAELLSKDPRKRPACAGDILPQLNLLIQGEEVTMEGLFAQAIMRTQKLLEIGTMNTNPSGSWDENETVNARRGRRKPFETPAGPAEPEEDHSPTSSAETQPDPRPVKLPSHRDSFVGRHDELRALQDLLDGASSLVTILGMGGTGKTRLALRYGQETADYWPGGVFFCDLTEVRSLEGICSSLAAVLEVPLTGGDHVEELGNILSHRPETLIILDNFEQVVEHGNRSVGKWMDMSEHTVFLITSRTVLSLEGEHSFPLSPMKEDESLELFVRRAQKIRPDYAPGPAEREQIGQLVALLDHLPLAIELAAARFRIMSPEKMLKWASKRFQLLTSNTKRTERQATLRGAIDWSWNLLTDWEKSALAQLSVFEGGWDLEAVGEVLNFEGMDDPPWPMDVLQSLVDKSLVRTVQEDRFDLLVSVREYAQEKLREMELEEETRLRHALYFAEPGSEEAIDSLYRHHGRAVLASLMNESDNILASLEYGMSTGRSPIAVNGLRSMAVVIEKRGPYQRFNQLAPKVLAMESLTRSERATCLMLMGRMTRVAGNGDEAIVYLQEAVEISRHEQLHRVCIRAMAGWANILTLHDRLDEGVTLWNEAESLARKHRLQTELVHVLLHRGDVEGQRGNTAYALTLLQEAHAIAAETGNETADILASCMIGYLDPKSGEEHLRSVEDMVAVRGSVREKNLLSSAQAYHALHHKRDFTGARDYMLTSLQYCKQMGVLKREAVLYDNLGEVTLLMGHLEDSRAYFEKAIRYGRETWPLVMAIAGGGLALVHVREGRLEEAIALITESESALREADFQAELAKFLARKAQVLFLAGQRDTAENAREEAAHLRKSIHSPEATLLIHLEEYEELKSRHS